MARKTQPEPTEQPEQPEPPATPHQGRAGRYAKTTLTVRPKVLDEAKDGFWLMLGKGEYRTFAEYVSDALAMFNQHIQAEHNDGQPFPARPQTAHKLPTITPR